MRNIREVPGFENGTSDFLKFLVFLGAVLMVSLVVAVSGSIHASVIWHLTGLGAESIRIVAICGLLGFALGGLWEMSTGHEKWAMFHFAMVAIFASIWIGAIGPWLVIEGFLTDHQITNWVVEVTFGFVFIIAGLIGALVNSGFQLSSKK